MGKKLIDDDKMLKMLKEGKPQKEIAAFFGVSPAAVCRRIKRLLPLPKSVENLTPKEQKFVRAVAGGATQTQAALKSFEVSSMDSAKNMGSQLMKKPSIQDAVSDLLEYYGMGRVYRIKKLRAHAENRDPGVSLKSIDIANKMDGVYTESRPDQTINVKQEIAVLQMDARRLEEERERLKAQLAGITGEVVDAEFKNEEANGEDLE